MDRGFVVTRLRFGDGGGFIRPRHFGAELSGGIGDSGLELVAVAFHQAASSADFKTDTLGLLCYRSRHLLSLVFDLLQKR